MLVLRPPVITGMTTINEGDILYLDCDAIGSNINVMWLSPEGVVVSNEMSLVIMNIQRSAAGIYTCVATHKFHGSTRNSTVNVIVQCECYYSVYLYMYSVICEEGELETCVHVTVTKFVLTMLVTRHYCICACIYKSHYNTTLNHSSMV